MNELCKLASSMLVLISLSGCTRGDCWRYEGYVKDNRLNLLITEWADRDIFASQLEEKDIGIGWLAGPGKGSIISRGRSSLAEAGIGGISDSLFGPNEIRWIGRDRLNPDGVFIGRSSYNGLIIARKSLAELESASGFSFAGDQNRGRVSLTCYDRP